MRKVILIQGMQYGSEAKGAVAAGIARTWKPDTVATAWGPNAGHTVVDGDFRFVSTMLATGALYPETRTILIGPGSVVDLDKLVQEVTAAGPRLNGKMLIIHPQAVYLKPEHAEQERSLVRIGSTMKGTMQAAIAKMHRVESALVRSAPYDLIAPLHRAAAMANLRISFSEHMYNIAVDDSDRLVLEGAQGFSLSMHGQFYPYCTSRDVSPAQTLADCRIPIPSRASRLAVVGVMRTFPIRVANRCSDDGQEFTSGGFYGDQHELDWEKHLDRKPELTTVTKLPRRIFSFSYEQINAAVRQLRPTALCLTFCDYLESRPTDLRVGPKVRQLMHAIQDTINRVGINTVIDTVSYGPDQTDIYNVVSMSGRLGTNPFDYDHKDYNDLFSYGH